MMATATRPESHLPTIKCSTCAQEIDLLSLADHICEPPLESSETEEETPGSDLPHLTPESTNQSNQLKLDPATQSLPAPTTPQNSVRHIRSGKNIPPRIDAFAANQPFLQLGSSPTPLSDFSNYSDGQSTAPFSPSTQTTTPSSMYSQKPSLHSRSPNPPSPNLASNFDCAFPPLVLRPSLSHGAKGNSTSNSSAPLSPRPQGGAEVLQRMNTIAPGPFGHRARPSQERLPNVEARGAHSRNGSGSLKQQQFRNEQGRQHFRKPSIASSFQSGSHYSQPSVDSQSNNWPHESEFCNPARPSEAIDKFLDELQSEPATSPVKSPGLRKASTFPEVVEVRSRPKFIGAGLTPSPSAPHHRTQFFQGGSIEQKRPGTSAGATGSGYGGFSSASDPAVQNPPSHFSHDFDHSTSVEPRRPRSRTITHPFNLTSITQIPNFERPRASPQPPGENKSTPTISRAGSRERIPNSAGNPPVPNAAQDRSETTTRPPQSDNGVRPLMPVAPFLPTLNRLMTDQPTRREMHHSPSDSGSSCYTTTGRSTPPSSVGSSTSRSGSIDSTNERHWDGGALKASSCPQPSILSRSRMPALNDLYNPPESPVDPAIHKMRLPNEAPIEIRPRIVTTESQPGKAPNMRPFLRAATAATAFNRPVPTKGNCAACQQPIYGKSIKAASGKLTGRYHKECFACKTCQAPFPTAEFYVHDNAPYCGRHYHELNGSLCRKCDAGIEGQYLQTDRKEKYHAHCFSCMECRVRLTEDYFEVNGQPFCERHAYSMTRNRGQQYGNGDLGVHGSNRPEKRRTRLMMM